MKINLSLIFILLAIFGAMIIVDFEYLSQWEKVKVNNAYGDYINGGRHSSGEYAMMMDIGSKTVVVDPNYATHIRAADSVKILSSKIFKQISIVQVPINEIQAVNIPLEYSIKNGNYIFPITLIISSLLAFGAKSNKLKGYSTMIAAIVTGFVLYVMFLQ